MVAPELVPGGSFRPSLPVTASSITPPKNSDFYTSKTTPRADERSAHELNISSIEVTTLPSVKNTRSAAGRNQKRGVSTIPTPITTIEFDRRRISSSATRDLADSPHGPSASTQPPSSDAPLLKASIVPMTSSHGTSPSASVPAPIEHHLVSTTSRSNGLCPEGPWYHVPGLTKPLELFTAKVLVRRHYTSILLSAHTRFEPFGLLQQKDFISVLVEACPENQAIILAHAAAQLVKKIIASDIALVLNHITILYRAALLSPAMEGRGAWAHNFLSQEAVETNAQGLIAFSEIESGGRIRWSGHTNAMGIKYSDWALILPELRFYMVMADAAEQKRAAEVVGEMLDVLLKTLIAGNGTSADMGQI